MDECPCLGVEKNPMPVVTSMSIAIIEVESIAKRARPPTINRWGAESPIHANRNSLRRSSLMLLSLGCLLKLERAPF